MTVTRRQFVSLAPGLPVLCARAQGWPTRPVRVVVPLPPGSGTDVAARFANERAEAYLRYRGVLGFAWLTLSARAEVCQR